MKGSKLPSRDLAPALALARLPLGLRLGARPVAVFRGPPELPAKSGPAKAREDPR